MGVHKIGDGSHGAGAAKPFIYTTNMGVSTMAQPHKGGGQNIFSIFDGGHENFTITKHFNPPSPCIIVDNLLTLLF